MLRGIWEFVDTLGHHLAQASLLSKPLARQASDRVPSYFYGPWLATDINFPGRDHARCLAET